MSTSQSPVFLILVASLVPSILALIAALAWNGLFVEIFDRLNSRHEIVALFIYAIVVTLLAIGVGFAFFEINKKRFQDGHVASVYGGTR